jgi:hypothetical protein
VIGSKAFTAAGGSQNNNDVFGYQAAASLTGSNNIIIGWNTASTTAGGNNNIAIGHDVALPSTNGSNQLDIGNLIFGTGITAKCLSEVLLCHGPSATRPGRAARDDKKSNCLRARDGYIVAYERRANTRKIQAR